MYCTAYVCNAFSCHYLGAPVRSTSYIDEPDSPPARDNNSASISPEPSSHRSLELCHIPQNNTTNLSQSYLNLIDDLASHDHHTEPEHSDEGSILFSAGAGGAVGRELELESEVKQNNIGSVSPVINAREEKLHVLGNGHAKGRVRPPDIVLDSQSTVPGRTARLRLGVQDDNTAGMNWGNLLQQEGAAAAAANGGSKVTHGHPRTRQRNIHCQETEV